MTSPRAADSPIRPTSRRVRADLRLLSIWVFTVPTVMRYKPDVRWGELSGAPAELLGRLEAELAGEAGRYRAVFAAIVGVVLMPLLLAGFLWSGLYWLPIRVPWFPFFRGAYGLPYLSLFEWIAFLLLAAFFAYTWAVLRTSRMETRRMAVDLTRLSAVDMQDRRAVAQEALTGVFPRAAYVLRKAKPFASYRSLLTPEDEL